MRAAVLSASRADGSRARAALACRRVRQSAWSRSREPSRRDAARAEAPPSSPRLNSLAPAGEGRLATAALPKASALDGVRGSSASDAYSEDFALAGRKFHRCPRLKRPPHRVDTKLVMETVRPRAKRDVRKAGTRPRLALAAVVALVVCLGAGQAAFSVAAASGRVVYFCVKKHNPHKGRTRVVNRKSQCTSRYWVLTINPDGQVGPQGP